MALRWLGPFLLTIISLVGCVVVPIPIGVVGTTGGAPQAAAPVLRDDALRSALAGRTLSGQGQVIQLAANGTTRLDLGWTQTSGTWRVSGDNLCMTAPIPGAGTSNTCARARVNGNRVTLTDPGNGPTVTYTLS